MRTLIAMLTLIGIFGCADEPVENCQHFTHICGAEYTLCCTWDGNDGDCYYVYNGIEYHCEPDNCNDASTAVFNTIESETCR